MRHASFGGVLFPAILALILSAPPAAAGTSLHFDGVDDHVTMGAAPGLGLAAFTVECWFRWDGEGAAASSGVGGVSAVPLVSKGRGESDGGTQDMNYFLGIRPLDGVLVADFEDMATGLNHPVAGMTRVIDGNWHHAAVSYDGNEWVIYLDGLVDGTADTGGATPRQDSLQHFGVAAAFDTAGEAQGCFRGAIDEVRVWNVPLTAEDLWSRIDEAQGEAVPGLVARWGFDEEGGAVAGDSVGGIDGTIVGASWSADAPFDASRPPETPVLVGPADGEEDVYQPVTLGAGLEDPEGDSLQAWVYGRIHVEDDGPLSIVALPDTQYYSCECRNGSLATFLAQTGWVADHRGELGISFVAHLGDISDSGDAAESQWVNADEALSILEDPARTDLSEGIPYGLCVGNHDQSQGGPDAPTALYNQYFGVDRFEGRSFYGGHFGDNNDSHYVLFSAGAVDFVAVFLEFEAALSPDVLDWVDGILEEHADRRAIVSTHYMVTGDGRLSAQGEAIYEALKHHANLILMMGGHIDGEAWRSDAYQGRTVYSMLADYQFRENGGDGWLRIIELEPRRDLVRVRTYSPTRDEFEEDLDSAIVFPHRMHDAGFTLLAGPIDVLSGEEVGVEWEDLEPGTVYDWFVEVSDGRLTVGPIWSFTAGTQRPEPEEAAETADDVLPPDTHVDGDASGDAGEDGVEAYPSTGGCSCS